MYEWPIKRFSTLLVIRETHIKTRRYDFTPTGMAKIKKTDKPSVDENMEKQEFSKLLLQV